MPTLSLNEAQRRPRCRRRRAPRLQDPTAHNRLCPAYPALQNARKQINLLVLVANRLSQKLNADRSDGMFYLLTASPCFRPSGLP